MNGLRANAMFTGLVSATGAVSAIADAQGVRRMRVDTPYDAASIKIGASICHNGVCLTVVDVHANPGGAQLVVDVAAESLKLTTLGRLKQGDMVNLERSLQLGDELGGHLVSGHVDGMGEVVSATPEGLSWRVHIRAPAAIAGLIAPKGSIAVDGVSLTVNSVRGSVFDVLIIPHTWEVTTLSRLQAGDVVNLEADMLARYVARLLSYTAEQKAS